MITTEVITKTMTTTELITIVSLLIALSGASERLTEIIKGLIPFLNKENTDDPASEGRRRSLIQTIAVVSGIITAFLSSSVIEPILKTTIGGNDQNWNSFPAIFALGLLASFGAAFWNSILEYLIKTKDIQESTAKRLNPPVAESPDPPAPNTKPAEVEREKVVPESDLKDSEKL